MGILSHLGILALKASPCRIVFSVPFCDALRSLFVFVLPILVSFIFPRQPVLTTFLFSQINVFPHLARSQNLFNKCSYLIQIVIQHHLWKTTFFLTLQLLPYSHPACCGGPFPYLSDEFIILTENCQSEGRSVSGVVGGL